MATLALNAAAPERLDSPRGLRPPGSLRTPTGAAVSPAAAKGTAEATAVGTPRSPRPKPLGSEAPTQDMSFQSTVEGNSVGPGSSLCPGSPSSSLGLSLGSPSSRGRLNDSVRGQGSQEDLQALVAAMTQRTVPWNPDQWLEARQQLLDQGRVTDLPVLMRCVRQTSERALKLQSYQTEGGEVTVDLGSHLMFPECVHWFGRRNVEVPPMPTADKSKVEPPIIVVDQNPLDLVSVISGFEGIDKHPISIVTEVTEGFDDNGMLNINATRSIPVSMQNLNCRTDFARFAEAATSSLRSGRATIRDHLTASHDPYVFVAPTCTLFRGDRDEGYPFLEHPVHMRTIVCAMACSRPSLLTSTNRSTLEKTEWYASDMDQTALLERLSLIGFAALQDRDPGTKSILVLSALGCSERGLHPRHAVANSLKHWRSRFARLFHAVFLACGPDRELAAQFDLAINRQVYSTLVTEEVSAFIPWHWDRRYLSMHINFQDLSEIANMVEAEADSDSGSDLNSDSDPEVTAPKCHVTDVSSPKGSVSSPGGKSRTSKSQQSVQQQMLPRRHSLLDEITDVMKEHETRAYTANQAEADITELYLQTERLKRDRSNNTVLEPGMGPSRTSSRASLRSQSLLAPSGQPVGRTSRASSFCSSQSSRPGGASTVVSTQPRRLSMSTLMDKSRGRRFSIEHRMGHRRASFQTMGGRRGSRSSASGAPPGRRSSRRNSSAGSRSSLGSDGSVGDRGSRDSRNSQGLFEKIQDKFKDLTVKENGRTKPKMYRPPQEVDRGVKIRVEVRRRLSTSKAEAESAAAAATAAAAAAPGQGAPFVPVPPAGKPSGSRPGTTGSLKSEQKAEPAVPPTASSGRAALRNHDIWGQSEEKGDKRDHPTAGEALRQKVAATKQPVQRRTGGSFNPATFLAAGMENLEQMGAPAGAPVADNSSQMPTPKSGAGGLQTVVAAVMVGALAPQQQKPEEEWQVRMDLHDLAAAFKARSEEIQLTGRKGANKAPRQSEFQQRKSKLLGSKRKSGLAAKDLPRGFRQADPVKGFENAMMADLAHSSGVGAEQPEQRTATPRSFSRAKEAASPSVKDSMVLPPVVSAKATLTPVQTPQSARPSSRLTMLQADSSMTMDTARASAMRKFNVLLADRGLSAGGPGSSPRSTSARLGGSRLEMGDVGQHNMMLRG